MNMQAITAMMGALGGGAALDLPALNLPCGVCVVTRADTPLEPDRAVTAVLGTPVCVMHGRQLADALLEAR